MILNIVLCQKKSIIKIYLANLFFGVFGNCLTERNWYCKPGEIMLTLLEVEVYLHIKYVCLCLMAINMNKSAH